MKGAIIYFSLTGNTKLACEYINRKIKGITFDLLDMRDGIFNLDQYDLVGFATYSDDFGIAKFVEDYMRKMNVNDKYAFVFSTYGRNNGATTYVLAQEARKKGFKIISDHSLNTPENYPPVVRIEHGHVNNPTLKQMNAFNQFILELQKKCEIIKSGKSLSEHKIKVNLYHLGVSKTNKKVFAQNGYGK